MPASQTFDVILFGYRNDIARERTLDFLRQLPLSESGPFRIATDVSHPQRLFAELAAPQAEQLHAQLERFGAQVALVSAGLQRPVAGNIQTTPVAPAGVTWRVIPLLLALAFLVVVQVRHHRRGVGAVSVPVPRITAAMEPLRTHDERLGPPESVRLNGEAIVLAEKGTFDEATDRLQRALRLAPDDPVLRRNLQTVLLQWGLSDLGADRLDDASDHLAQAARLGDRAEVLQAQAVTFLRQSRLPEAAAALERALTVTPGDRNVLLMLGQVYARQDKRPQALEALQRAKEAGASGAEFDKLVEQLSREVDAEWDYVQLESAHFRVSFADDEDRRAVRFVLDSLEDARDVVDRKLGYDPSERTAVVLYTQRDFHSVTETPDWAGGAFDGRIKIPVRGLTEDDPGLIRVTRHEYAHSVIAQITGGHCPVWLNEGLAVWAEEDYDGDREAGAEKLIADRELFTLSELNRPFVSLPKERAGVAYAESYLAVRYLVDHYGARKIPSLLEALKSSADLNDAFAAVYPGDFAAFQSDLLRHLSGQ